MSETLCRMAGLFMMLISVFLLIGGLYLENAGLPSFVPPLCLLSGLVLLCVGLVFYHVIRRDDL